MSARPFATLSGAALLEVVEENSAQMFAQDVLSRRDGIFEEIEQYAIDLEERAAKLRNAVAELRLRAHSGAA